MALSAKYRLSDKSEIKKTLKMGKRLDSDLFYIKFLPNSANLSRFAIITGLKVSKSAVLRNRIRRRLSEIIRLNILEVKSGYNIVLMIKPRALSQEYKNLKGALIKELSKIGQ